MFRCCNELINRLCCITISRGKKDIKDKEIKDKEIKDKEIKDKEIKDKDCYTLDTLKSFNIDLAYLDNIVYTDTRKFIPPVKYGKVIKVYDGDTITIACKLEFENSPIYRFSVRLAGIDSPEMKAKTSIEKMLALKSQMALSNKLMDRKIRLENVNIEKYGRLLADVYLYDTNINQWMIENNFAVPYDGGTKNRPTEWDE